MDRWYVYNQSCKMRGLREILVSFQKTNGNQSLKPMGIPFFRCKVLFRLLTMLSVDLLQAGQKSK